MQRVKSYVQSGATQAFTAPLAAYKGALIPLTTLVAGTTASAAGLVLSMANPQTQIEWSSLVALVETDLTTNTITVASKWQGSMDGTNWVDIELLNGTAAIQVAAAGTGSLVTTQYFHPLAGIDPSIDYLRLAVLTGVVTGGAGDNVTVSYGFRKRTFTLN